MQAWVYAIISVVLVSLISLIGVFTLSFKKERLKKVLTFLVSFAVGGLFGDAFLHLLPESFEKLGITIKTSALVLLGILTFFILEKFLRWRHCHIPTSKEHSHPLFAMNLVGDTVHNFFDGIIIGASFLVSIPIGITTTLAIIFHEIPQEIGDFGIFLYWGVPIKKALVLNFLSALSAIFGTIASLILGPKIGGYIFSLLPFTAGGFLYIAGSDLIPELHHEVSLSTSFWQFILIIFGISIMALLTLLE